PQQIVATRLLYCLQYPIPIQVICKGFTPAHIFITIHRLTQSIFPHQGPNPSDLVHKHSSIWTL
ncbi:hypothetical protein BS47DRAFT_1286714, partial [Hydnum rufescens UP504]